MEINGIPKVSVILSVYNTEKYLRQCLDSIAGQALREIEILCVNDGSTDGSPTILEEYAARDSRFRVFTKENEGLGAAPARNYGLERVSGQYVSVLDSDDFFAPEMLEKAVRRADATDADVVIFGGYEYDDRHGTSRRVDSILNESLIPAGEVFSRQDYAGKLYQLTQGMAWNKLFRRSFLEKLGLRFQRIKYTDDSYFTFAHLALADRLAVVDEPLCHYRVRTGTSQSSGIADYPDSAYRPYTKLRSSLVEWGLYSTLKQSFVNCAAAFIRRSYDEIGRYEPFRYLHEKLRNEVFDELDISGQPESFFYDKRLYQWVRQVMENGPGELAFKAARAFGGDSTTGILRFQFPYDRIPRGSRLALIGDDAVGRHYYAQLTLSGYCDVTIWAGEDNPFRLSCVQGYGALADAAFDYALITSVQPERVDRAIAALTRAGTPGEKIVLASEKRWA